MQMTLVELPRREEKVVIQVLVLVVMVLPVVQELVKMEEEEQEDLVDKVVEVVEQEEMEELQTPMEETVVVAAAVLQEDLVGVEVAAARAVTLVIQTPPTHLVEQVVEAEVPQEQEVLEQ
jgi:hypothetical protein